MASSDTKKKNATAASAKAPPPKTAKKETDELDDDELETVSGGLATLPGTKLTAPALLGRTIDGKKLA